MIDLQNNKKFLQMCKTMGWNPHTAEIAYNRLDVSGRHKSAANMAIEYALVESEQNRADNAEQNHHFGRI